MYSTYSPTPTPTVIHTHPHPHPHFLIRAHCTHQPVQPDIAPRPCHPLVAFGFGGSMVVLFPRREREGAGSLDSSSFGFPDEHDTENTHSKPGNIRIMDVSSLLASDSSVTALKNNFPGPLRVGSLTTATNAMNFCEQQAQLAGSGSSSAILWRLLALRVKHSGSVRPTAAAAGDNLVCMCGFVHLCIGFFFDLSRIRSFSHTHTPTHTHSLSLSFSFSFLPTLRIPPLETLRACFLSTAHPHPHPTTLSARMPPSLLKSPIFWRWGSDLMRCSWPCKQDCGIMLSSPEATEEPANLNEEW